MSSPISDIPLLLFFIYDVEKSISESDDPLESILYFHPNSESAYNPREGKVCIELEWEVHTGCRISSIGFYSHYP
ncbi:uncharacterized protein LOC130700902 isoform X2 [Daphnia carinata]|uniref:uncharacterized protein LOC130700902 isoform X2 n=1 Tax=Daphnia carinata TaxID=120202 RepID=UPI00257D43F7|nr:uncharacterized protein LOC130700902 isoform X2 [Daphnia carinata]